MKAGTIVATLLLTGFSTSIVPAQTPDAYPSRPIQLVVPVAAGGGLDTAARFVAQRFSAALGQPIVVDNRPGGSQNIGIRSVAKAAPDGYTLLHASNTITINPALFKKLDYDVNTDLAPIGKVVSLPLLIIAGAEAPYKTLPELIAYARANPGKLSYGSPGTGTPHHLGMELLKSEAGVDIQHIPYKGATPGVTDLLAGTIPLLVTTYAPAQAHLASGKLRALVTLDPKRVDQFPDVPAASETLAGFDVGVWHGLFAPGGTSPKVLEKLSSTLETVIKDADLAAQLRKLSVLTSWQPPAELRATIKREQAQWAAAIAKAGIKTR